MKKERMQGEKKQHYFREIQLIVFLNPWAKTDPGSFQSSHMVGRAVFGGAAYGAWPETAAFVQHPQQSNPFLHGEKGDHLEKKHKLNQVT